jgi:hypothetical protein
VINSGKVEVDDVVILVKLPWGHLEQSRASAPPGVNYSEARQGDSITVTVPNLNPTEAIQVSLVVSSSSGNLPEKPDVSVRGKGVLGTLESDSIQTKESSSFLNAVSISIAAVGLTFGLFVALQTYKITRGSGGQRESGPDRGHRSGQRYVLAYLCRLFGLPKLADGYLERDAETAYWAECDRLGSLAIEDESLRKQITEVLAHLPEYAETISDNAKAVALYNLARIDAFSADYENCKQHLNAALALSPNEIKARLKLDKSVADAQLFVPM